MEMFQWLFDLLGWFAKLIQKVLELLPSFPQSPPGM